MENDRIRFDFRTNMLETGKSIRSDGGEQENREEEEEGVIKNQNWQQGGFVQGLRGRFQATFYSVKMPTTPLR